MCAQVGYGAHPPWRHGHGCLEPRKTRGSNLNCHGTHNHAPAPGAAKTRENMRRYGTGLWCLLAAAATTIPLSCDDNDPEDCELLPERIEEDMTIRECARVDRTSVQNGATLTVQPGATIYFLEGGYLSVNRLQSGARIIANAGDGEEPITFTSGRTNPEAGAWQCLWVGGGESASSFEGVEFEYGGAPCEVNGRMPAGMLVLNAEIDKVHDAQFLQSSTYGLFLEQDGAIKERVENSRFSLSAIAPIRVPFSAVLSVGEGNSYDEGSYIAVDSLSRLLDAGEWVAQKIPYRLLRDTRDGAGDALGASISTRTPGSPPNTVVTIQPGTTIQLDNGTLGVLSAAVIAEGTEDAPITFTSAEDDPAPGDWGCVLLQGEIADAPSSFRHVIFEYGGSGVNCTGANYEAPLVFGSSDTTVRDCTFRNSAGRASIISGRVCDAEPGSEPWCIVGNEFDDDLTYETMCQWTTGLYCLLDE